jgi:DNA (cytosine-5)-methyltransferase 1
MTRPLALDLFCGAGGASMGLHRAGFDVVGVDIKRQPRYPFTFIQGDALNPPLDLSRFDLIWASPPCQAYTVANAAYRYAGGCHPALVERTRELLAGHPITIIENVPGAPLRADLVLDGTMFPDLRVIRRRHFELSFRAPFALGFDASDSVSRHRWASPRKGGAVGGNSKRARARYGFPAVDPMPYRGACMGIDWMTRDGLGEAIPPAYSEFIGRAAMGFAATLEAAA